MIFKKKNKWCKFPRGVQPRRDIGSSVRAANYYFVFGHGEELCYKCHVGVGDQQRYPCFIASNFIIFVLKIIFKQLCSIHSSFGHTLIFGWDITLVEAIRRCATLAIKSKNFLSFVSGCWNNFFPNFHLRMLSSFVCTTTISTFAGWTVICYGSCVRMQVRIFSPGFRLCLISLVLVSLPF